MSGVAGELLDLGHAPLWRPVGLVAVAQDADHGAHLVERARGRLLDDLEGARGSVRPVGGDRPPGLGLDGDRRHVVGDRVVQLAASCWRSRIWTWSISRSRALVR